MMVLLLDDEALVLWDLEEEMRDAGMETITASSVDRALALIAHRVPDVAILDVNLGAGVTCEPVADRLSELGVPFVLHSGDLNRSGEVIRRFDVPLLPKPTPAYRLVEAVRALR